MRTRPKIHSATVIFSLSWFLLISANDVRAQLSVADAEQKAAYLRKFLEFVRWPEDPAGNKSNFQICVDGDPLLAFALSVELQGVKLQSHRVNVRVLKQDEGLRACRALVFGLTDKKHIARDLESIKDVCVLTFGQTNQFLEAGGIVQLSTEEDGVHFGVNLDAARKAGVKLDARLLTLAKRVIRSEGSTGG